MDGVEQWPDEAERRYREAGYWRDETLGDLLRAWAQRSGDAVAVVGGTRRLTYTELDARADRTAAGLLGLGIRPGDRVVLQLPNDVDLVVVLFALLRTGAVPVLSLLAHRRVEIDHFVTHSGAVAYICPDVSGGFDHRELAEQIHTPPHVIVAGEPGRFRALDDLPEGPAELPEVRAGDVAVLLISGGTTGKPKLIPRTHRDYAYNARASAEVCELTASDVYLAALPATHNFPLACPGILGVLGTGGTVVMSPVPSPDVAFALIERERVTVTALVPPLIDVWLEAAPGYAADLSSLRLVQAGGAKLDASLARRVRPELGAEVQQVFGMAEGLLNYTRPGDPDELVATTQGRPLSPDDEVRVVDEDGADVPEGGVGELWTRGPYTLRGYYRAAEYNAGAFTADGFFRTGDLVRQLPSGHLVVEGRVKDVINRGGENVSAGELEQHLLEHPSITRCAVVGLPGENLNEVVCAVVVVAPGLERRPKLKDLNAFLSERGLARFMLPDRLAVVDEFPLTAVGKIDKRALATRLT